jgi:BatD DUF11 like domain
VSPRVRLGEPFVVDITVTSGKDVVVNLPSPSLAEPFEIVAHRESTAPAENELVDRTFTLSVVAWEPGKKTLPAIPLQMVSGAEVKEVKTDPIEVEVVGIVTEEGARPGGLAGPVSVYERDWRLVYAGGGVLAVLLLWVVGRWLRRKWSRRPHEAAPVVVDLRPPHEIALAKLAALAPPSEDDPRPFYFAMTEIVREYLGARFAFDAMEQTTTELLESLRAIPAAHPHVDGVRAWVEGCDLVKFASFKVPADDARAALADARAIIERSVPPPPVAAPTEVRA